MAVSFCGKRLLLIRNNIFKTQKRNGYVVLLPEIGEDLTEKNPLLSEETKLPDFKRITIERCIAAVNKQSVDFEQGIKSLEKNIEKKQHFDIFTDIINPLEELQVPLEATWGVTKALCFGDKPRMPTKCYTSIVRRVSIAYSYKYSNKSIFQACKTALEKEDNNFTKEQERLLSKFLLEGKLNGLDLKTKKGQDTVGYIYEEIAKQQKIFRNRLEVDTRVYSQIIRDPHIMRDFPEGFLRRVAADPDYPYQGPWRITLQPYVVSTFLEYCPDTSLRKDIWRAKVLRCSLYGDQDCQTSTTLENIRSSRNEVARALGYKSFAHMSMDTKMAGSLKNIYDVFDTLLQTARPAQEREIAELNSFAKERGFDGGLIKQWDVPYWSRKQRRATFKYEENIVQEYFPLPKVLEGLFKLTETLFHIKVVEGPKPSVWHQDVRFFNVCDLDNSDSEPIASFYFDPYFREDKMHESEYSGWMIGIRNKSKICNINPLAAIIFNFQPPASGKPSLLRFEDVKELFREFGKAFQHLLTTVNYTELAGLSNVEWDAADVGAHFMTNWVYEPSVISEISGHYETGKPLPQETIENLKNIRTHMAGYELCQKLYLSEFDLELHNYKEEFWVQLMARLWRKYFVIPEFKEDSHVCSFSEIFSGNMGAAYYSGLWSEMIAADVFSAFQEISPGDKAQQKIIGRRYRDTFLALGGSCSSNEIFRRFRGRDPSAKALLKNLGLKAVMPEKQIKV